MGFLTHLLILGFVTIVVIGGIAFVVIDMFGRVDYLKANFPWLERVLQRKSAFAVLLLVGGWDTPARHSKTIYHSGILAFWPLNQN